MASAERSTRQQWEELSGRAAQLSRRASEPATEASSRSHLDDRDRRAILHASLPQAVSTADPPTRQGQDRDTA